MVPETLLQENGPSRVMNFQADTPILGKLAWTHCETIGKLETANDDQY